MAEALLTDLVKEVGSIVFKVAKQEINLLYGVDEEVQKLQSTLGRIKAILDDAEERHPLKLRTEKLWLEQLQNQYYEMDDVLDTWNTARIRAKIEKEEGKPADTNAPAVVKKKVCSFFPSPSCCFNLALRHDVGHMIRKLNEKLDMVFKVKETDGIDFNRQPDVVERPITTSFVDVSHIIGRDNYSNDLLRNLLDVGSLEETNSYRVISLVGMGGIGKTTLAQLAYNHPDVQAHFQPRIWICVSDPFDQCKVAKAIIKEVDPDHGPLIDTELQTLLRKINGLIKDKKFFLVLDDVWIEDSQKWDPFKLALKNGVHGSRILVTTRKQTVAKMIGSALNINLEVLSDEDCWLIIRKIAFPNEDEPKDLEDLGRKLAIKCKGLPLAAKLLGSLMQDNRSTEQWNNILHSSLWELEDIEKGLLAPLLLSYYEISSTMKRCFLYCAIFPKDYLFSRDHLVVYWMAQGYVESKANKEMEVIVGEYFEKLVMRSFFQDFQRDEDSDGKIISCKMHDIVHDFARLMTKIEIFETDGDKEIDCQSARHLHLKVFKGMQPLESIYHAKSLRTLFLGCKMDDIAYDIRHGLLMEETETFETDGDKEIDCQIARPPTLFLLSHDMDYEFEMLLSNSFHHFRCLRTLILDYPIKKLPDAVGNLIHLRSLHMSANVRVVELPETICNLCNLQTLDVKEIHHFKKLPQGMSKLINLRHLMLHEFSDYKVVFPKGIGKLIRLRTLKRFNIGDKDDREGCKLGELKNLNQLRGTLQIYGMDNVVNVDEARKAQLKDKIHLRELVLWFANIKRGEERTEIDVEVLTALQLPPMLRRLEISYHDGNTIYPNLHILGQLPSLEVLTIVALTNVKKVGDEFLGIEYSKNKKDIFPNLKSLEFWHMRNWEEWIGTGGTGGGEEENDNGIVTNPIIMPRLQYLLIRDCDKLKSLPNYLLTAPLKKLELVYSKLLCERYHKETGENWHEISRISTVKVNGWTWVQRKGEPQFDSKTESGSEITDKDDVGAGSAECVVDERVEVDNDEGPEICEVDR